MGLFLKLGLRSRILAGGVGIVLLIPFVCLLGLAGASGYGAPDVLLHLFETTLPDVLWQTFCLGLGVVVLTSSMGVLPAWWVSVYDFPGRRWLEWVLMLPIAMPAYVVAYAYTDGLQYSGWFFSTLRREFGLDFQVPEIRSLLGAIAVLGCVLYPYVYILARSAFLRRSPSMLDAARSLGVGAVGVFWRVALPVARPAWVAGLALVLMEALSEYGALSYFGVQTFTTAIFKTWLSFSDRDSAALLSLFLLLFMLGLIVLEARARGRAQFHTQSGRSGRAQRRVLGGWVAWLLAGLCLMPVVLGFVLPIVFLLMASVQSHFEFFDVAKCWVLLRNSALLAFGAACVCSLLAMFFSYVRRLSSSAWVVAIHRVLSLGYGVPGAILAISILIPLAWFDRLTYGLGWGLPAVMGSVFGLMYAYGVRFTSAALQSMDAGLQQITRSMDESARVLGRSSFQVFCEVHLPLLRGAVATGFLLVFVDVVKELTATVMLRPFDFDTLAVTAYQFASDERLQEAAIPSLLIVLLTLLPTIVLIRQAAKQERRQ